MLIFSFMHLFGVYYNYHCGFPALIFLKHISFLILCSAALWSPCILTLAQSAGVLAST